MEQWKRTVAVWIMTAILFCGIPRPLAAWGQETPGELHAGFAVLIDGDTGRVLYGKNEKEIRPMAKYHQDHDLYPGSGSWEIWMMR